MLRRVVVVAVAALGLQLAVVPAAQGVQGPEVVAFDGDRIQVSTPPGAPPYRVNGAQPAVSPDGSRLAWIATAGNRPHVFVGAIDGTGARQVSGGDSWDSRPSWSPDGAWVAYSSYADGGVPHLWAVAADGTSNHLLGSYSGDAPVWSPDGRFIAFNNTRGGIGVVDHVGRGQALLTSGMGVSDWSPDGTRLAVRSAAGGAGVGVFRLGDRTASTVVADPAGERLGQAVFSPSGQQLYLNHEGGTKDNLFSVLERWSVNGTRDDTFHPMAMQFDGRVSAGGGTRAAPASTLPTPVGDVTASPAPSTVTLRFARPTGSESAGVTVRYAVGTTPPATITDGLDGGESLASVFTVGRLAPSTTYAFSVFARDWSGASSPPSSVTAATPAQVATTVSLSARPSVVTYGQASRLTGTLTREDTGAGMANAPVVLLGHHTGQADSVLARLTTDADGRFSIGRVPSQNTRYTVRYAGAGSLNPSGANVLVQVNQRVTIRFSPSSRIPAYSKATVTVTVAPAFPGGNVRVQQVSFSGHNVLTRLNSRSQVTVRLDTTRRDATAYVLVFPGARRGFASSGTTAGYVIY